MQVVLNKKEKEQLVIKLYQDVWGDNPPTKQIYLDCEYYQMWGNNRHRQ